MSRNLPRCACSNAHCTNTCFFLPLIVMRGRHPPSGGAAGDPRLCFGDCTLAKLHQEFTSQQCCQLYVWSGTRCGKWHLLRSLIAALLPCTSALQWGERETMQPLWRRREASRNLKKDCATSELVRGAPVYQVSPLGLQVGRHMAPFTQLVKGCGGGGEGLLHGRPHLRLTDTDSLGYNCRRSLTTWIFHTPHHTTMHKACIF